MKRNVYFYYTLKRAMLFCWDKSITKAARLVVKDTDLLAMWHANRAKKKLSKKYKKELHSELKNKNIDMDFPKIIWWSWLQGEEKAPELVKVCLQSIRQNITEDYEIKIITRDNLNEYIQLPQIILDKFDLGWIKGAQFADIIRLNLLSKYGGVWIDSTVFCTDGDFLKKIEACDMFMYRNLLSRDSKLIKMSSGLLSSKKNNPYMKEVASLITRYFEDAVYLDDYFICHIIMSLVAERYKKLWDDMPVYNNVDPHMLQIVFEHKFSEEQYKEIIKRSAFHKLNRHIDYSSSEYYQYIKNTQC